MKTLSNDHYQGPMEGLVEAIVGAIAVYSLMHYFAPPPNQSTAKGNTTVDTAGERIVKERLRAVNYDNRDRTKRELVDLPHGRTTVKRELVVAVE